VARPLRLLHRAVLRGQVRDFAHRRRPVMAAGRRARRCGSGISDGGRLRPTARIHDAPRPSACPVDRGSSEQPPPVRCRRRPWSVRGFMTGSGAPTGHPPQHCRPPRPYHAYTPATLPPHPRSPSSPQRSPASPPPHRRPPHHIRLTTPASPLPPHHIRLTTSASPRPPHLSRLTSPASPLPPHPPFPPFPR
jgi:hypothetical protein